jgi:nicotinate-nucleotide adenylyltransferase
LDKIGLFGGTFNPIHFAHLRTALEVKEGFGLKQIVLIPSAIPPHKDSEQVAGAKDRLVMLRLALEENRNFSVSDVELKRQGPSFTIDTVKHFRTVYNQNTLLYFIIGSDAFCELDTWKSHLELLSAIPFIVMVRPDSTGRNVDVIADEIRHFLQEKISKKYVFHPAKNGFLHPELPPVHIHGVTPLDISSTKIRGLVRRNRSIQYLVPPGVEQFIKTKGLYK